MKLSLIKVQDHHHQSQPQLEQNHQSHPLLFRAKIPISIFNFPFLSGFSTTTNHPSNLSLSLSTNFATGPTLKASYSTISATGTTASASYSANFSFSSNNPNPNPNPTFSLLVKPQLGSFSLRKSNSSNPVSDAKSNGEVANSFGFIPLESSMSLKDFSVDINGKNSILKGISAMARTEMPVAKRVSINFRWGVSLRT